MLQAAHNVSVPCFPAFARTSNTAEDNEGRQIRIAAADLYRQGRLAETGSCQYRSVRATFHREGRR